MANKVRNLRQKRGFSMEKLARLCDVSLATIGNIEHGAGAKVETMRRIAVALDVTIDDLLEEVAS